MKHIDLWNAYKELDELERQQLKAAVLAHGGEYVFKKMHEDEEENEEDDIDSTDIMPCIMAASGIASSYEDWYITRVIVDDKGYLTLYGYPKDDCGGDEYEINDVAHGGYGWIIDEIPETEEVKDVSEVGMQETNVIFSEEMVRIVMDGSLPEVKRYIKSEEFPSDMFKNRLWKTEDESRAYFKGLDDGDGWNEYYTLSQQDKYDKAVTDVLKKAVE